MKGHVECLLEATGDTAVLNTFDKLFRGGTGPQWVDRPRSDTPRYSLHGLFTVPEEIQKRGYQTAGHLWCRKFWNTPDDLTNMQVKRFMGVRRYRFYSPVCAPKNVFWKASSDFPTLHLRLFFIGVDRGDLQSHQYYEGYYQGGYSSFGEDDFAALREEMGFAV